MVSWSWRWEIYGIWVIKAQQGTVQWSSSCQFEISNHTVVVLTLHWLEDTCCHLGSGLVMCSWNKRCLDQTLVSWNFIFLSLWSLNCTMMTQHNLCCWIILIRLKIRLTKDICLVFIRDQNGCVPPALFLSFICQHVTWPFDVQHCTINNCCTP